MEVLEQEEEIVLVDIPNRSQRIDSLIARLMSHETHLSYSALKAFKDSPNDFIQYKFREKKQTDAMAFGSLVHCLILEPQEFENRYAILEDFDICCQIGGAKPRATKAYKEWKEVFLMDIGDKIVVSQEDYSTALSISNGVKNNRASAKILNQFTYKEQPIEWYYKNFKFLGFIDGGSEKILCDV